MIFRQFEQFIRSEMAQVTGDRTEILRYMWPSFELLGMEHVRCLPHRVLDIALPGLVFLGHVWRDRHCDLWEVVHDQSTNMAKQKWLWDALSSPDLAAARFENVGFTRQFPMNIANMRFAESTQEKQLQICDVLAGATTSYLRIMHMGSENRQYAESLSNAEIDKLIAGGIWPSQRVTPESLGMKGWDGNVAINWLSEQLTEEVSNSGPH